MKSVIDILDLSVEELDSLIKTGMDIAENPSKYAEKCRGKKLATLFFEPSTRTRLSFEAAMYELGGNVIGFSEANSSSAAKGESVADTAKVISCYADIIAMRHPLEGAPYVAALNATIPVINAGDGGHHHPTQTLTDLLTIYREKGKLGGLTIGLVGDLKYGRTVHSLIAAMSRYEGNRFILVSPDELKLPEYVMKDAGNAEFVQTTDLGEYMDQFDILYMTRIQRERFSDRDEYERLKDSYILTPDKLTVAKKDMRILHPLPRVNEISVKVDEDERACYFRQALNGKFIRMALILYLLSQADGKILDAPKGERGKYVCTNPKCITATEQELEHVYKKGEDGIYRCVYCDRQ